MTGVDPRAFEFALDKVEDGYVFEKFAGSYLSAILGYNFLPVGGLKDRGIDGLEHIFCRDGYERNIYQSSIEKNTEKKLESTLEKLKSNGIKYDQFYFVTNQNFSNKDIVIDRLFTLYKKPVHIYDLSWLSSNANFSDGTVRAFHIFVSSYLHEFNKPGKSYVISDLVSDPRLFVFLRQQWDVNRKDLDLDKLLADTLILYCLEGTDPDSNIFKTGEAIKSDIAKYIKYDPKLLHPTIDARLEFLASKPRKINFHAKENAYCLPYETRVEIQQRNLQDAKLYETFKKEVSSKLKNYLHDQGVQIKDALSLVEATINKVFYQQGLEFANFVLKGENQDAFEKELPDVISAVVDSSKVIAKNKEDVKASLLMTLRDIVYNGSASQKQYIKRLSNTYMMLFMMQCDPKLATYFSSMASKLNIYVCTSIIVPALSEIYLDPINKRHWNLLKGASDAGVSLVVNEAIIRELAYHLRMIYQKYKGEYKDVEDIYLGDEFQILYIDEILMRAYFYARMRKQTHNFNDFMDNFVSPALFASSNLAKIQEELIEWLRETFNIKFVSDKSLDVVINREEADRLFKALTQEKRHEEKAKTDANLILTIYAIRDKNNETAESGIFGFKTWWLSKDTLTLKTVNDLFRDRHRVGCYIRPDFLYNYISLAPSKTQVDAAYNALFPSLVGVNISFRLPSEIIDIAHQWLKEHKTKNHARLKAILRNLAEELKTNPKLRTRKYVEHYFDARLKELNKKKS